jgi:hypothetical protein
VLCDWRCSFYSISRGSLFAVSIYIGQCISGCQVIALPFWAFLQVVAIITHFGKLCPNIASHAKHASPGSTSSEPLTRLFLERACKYGQKIDLGCWKRANPRAASDVVICCVALGSFGGQHIDQCYSIAIQTQLWLARCIQSLTNRLVLRASLPVTRTSLPGCSLLIPSGRT